MPPAFAYRWHGFRNRIGMDLGENMKHFLIITLALGGFAAGCGLDRTTAPAPHEASWNLVRFHESVGENEESYHDLFVRADGVITLDDGRGNVASAVGLLAGENLETLARLIDALPPHSYVPPVPCAEDGFFVSVARDGEVLSYASDSCDPMPPEPLTEISTLLQDLLDEVDAPRTQVVPYSILLQGTSSAVSEARRDVIRDRDSLIRLLGAHHPEGPVALPDVDFTRQMIVAEFLGQRPSGGYSVTVEGAGKTESGWLQLEFVRAEPSPSCPAPLQSTQPYVLVAIERRSGGLLYKVQTVVTPC